MRLFLAILMVLSMPVILFAQQPGTPDKAQPPQLPVPPSLLSRAALCGKGTFLISLSGTAVGRETFDVACGEGGGFTASGKTDIKLPGATIDLQTSIELDKVALPLKFSAKGTMLGNPVDQTVSFKDGMATVTEGGKSQEVPTQKGSAMIMPNVPYLFAFVAARYDTMRGGEQTIPLFPNLTGKMTRTARDEVQATGAAAAPQPTVFDRYLLQLGPSLLVLWVDLQGRIAVLSLPDQKYVSAREEYTSFVEPLHVAVASQMKSLQPDYSAPPDAPFTAEEVTIKVKDYQLRGTLLLPKSGSRPFPAVITSTGSGQQTRDEPVTFSNMKTFRPFRQIAEHLAARGMAVLRVDDRGVGDSTGVGTLEKATTFDFADDVRAQVAYLRTRRELDPARIAIVGHSEGGVIAPLVAASDPQLAAIVLLAGTGKRGEDVLLYQLNRPFELNAALTEQERAKKRAEHQQILRTVIEGGDTSKLPQLFRYPWTRAFLIYDPLPTIRKVRQPILILQGALDRQVTVEQAELLAHAAREAGNKAVMVRVFPNLNHFFLPAKTGDESEYATLETTLLGEEVLRAIGDWLQFNLQKSEPPPKRR